MCGHYLAILWQLPDSINLKLLTDFSNKLFAKPDFMFPELNASFLCYIKGELQIRRGKWATSTFIPAVLMLLKSCKLYYILQFGFCNWK